LGRGRRRRRSTIGWLVARCLIELAIGNELQVSVPNHQDVAVPELALA
jgi:hypothetical protein